MTPVEADRKACGQKLTLVCPYHFGKRPTELLSAEFDCDLRSKLVHDDRRTPFTLRNVDPPLNRLECEMPIGALLPIVDIDIDPPFFGGRCRRHLEGPAEFE